MNEVRDDDFRGQTGDDTRKEDCSFWYGWAHEIEGGGQDDDVEDVVDEA